MASLVCVAVARDNEKKTFAYLMAHSGYRARLHYENFKELLTAHKIKSINDIGHLSSIRHLPLNDN